MFLLRDLENLVAVACTAAGAADNGYEPTSPTTSTEVPPPTVDLKM